MNDSSEFDAIELLLDGGVVAYQRALARAVGDATTGLLLSQFWYWSKRLDDSRDGWFYKTQDEILEETVLSRREQETARRNLRDLGLLEEKKHGVPARLWFRVDRQAVKRLLQKHAAQHGGKRHPRMRETDMQARREPPNQSVQKRQPNTKTTAKSTSESTAAATVEREPSPPSSTAAADSDLVAALITEGLNRFDALRLESHDPDECRRQLEYLPYHTARANPGGWLRDAIEKRHAPPKGYQETLSRARKRARQAEQQELAKARESHKTAHRDEFLSYLSQREEELKKAHPEAFSAFLTQESETRANYERGPLPPSTMTRVLEYHERRDQYLLRIESFFSKRQECATLAFWEWDSQVNPIPFMWTQGKNGTSENRNQ